MRDPDPPSRQGCCESAAACVFTKALLARAAVCELAERHAVAERDILECRSPVARINCSTLAALLHERARFALRLPAPTHPLMHAQALRLQCGGLLGMKQALQASEADVHRMVGAAHERLGSLTALPWDAVVAAIQAWQPRQRRRPSATP